MSRLKGLILLNDTNKENEVSNESTSKACGKQLRRRETWCPRPLGLAALSEDTRAFVRHSAGDESATLDLQKHLLSIRKVYEENFAKTAAQLSADRIVHELMLEVETLREELHTVREKSDTMQTALDEAVEELQICEISATNANEQSNA
jgi:hypothetical protein